jgi:hypothetical protein
LELSKKKILSERLHQILVGPASKAIRTWSIDGSTLTIMILTSSRSKFAQKILRTTLESSTTIARILDLLGLTFWVCDQMSQLPALESRPRPARLMSQAGQGSVSGSLY